MRRALAISESLSPRFVVLGRRRRGSCRIGIRKPIAARGPVIRAGSSCSRRDGVVDVTIVGAADEKLRRMWDGRARLARSGADATSRIATANALRASTSRRAIRECRLRRRQARTASDCPAPAGGNGVTQRGDTCATSQQPTVLVSGTTATTCRAAWSRPSSEGTRRSMTRIDTRRRSRTIIHAKHTVPALAHVRRPARRPRPSPM